MSVWTILRTYYYMKLCYQNLNTHKNIYFYTFFKIKIYNICQNLKLFCQIICLKLLSCTDLSGNTIYEMKICLNIGRAFKLFQILVLINLYDKCLQKSKKKLLYFYLFLFFNKKTIAQCLLCIISFNITEFMQSKLKESQLFSFSENYL